MAAYLVNAETDDKGNHEVHTSTCTHLPKAQHRRTLGAFSGCHTALAAARRYYNKVDGCYYCCKPCHSG